MAWAPTTLFPATRAGNRVRPCTLRRARLASCLAALGARWTIVAIASKDRKYILQNKGKPLVGSQPFEYHEQRDTYLSRRGFEHASRKPLSSSLFRTSLQLSE